MSRLTVDFISDLHTDFYVATTNPEKERRIIRKFVETLLPENPGQVLALAGDIGHYNRQTRVLLEEFKRVYSSVLMVYGNHDMYLHNPTVQQKYHWSTSRRIEELKVICRDLDVHLLDGDIVTIGGVRFGGLCGWYDVQDPDNFRNWISNSNDSQLISPKYTKGFKKRYQKIDKQTPQWDTELFYDDQVQKLRGIAQQGCDVLITHVVQLLTPKQYLEPKFRNDPDNVFYYTDNLNLINHSGAKVYIHGHVHTPMDYLMDNFRVLSNPYGYPGENDIKKIKQIEI